MEKDAVNPTAPWACPKKEVLEEIFNCVRVEKDHDQIIETVPWCRFDTENEVATIMLSTINFSLMQAVRHAIRTYTGRQGKKYETYSKAKFVQKYGITCYVPRDYACIAPSRLLRTLFFKYQHL